jgi:DNA-binding response OmpR family regulator
MPDVLIIDDSPMLLELVTRALSGAGIESAAAMDLASLDEQLSKAKFDLILVDINMPEMFGDDVVEFLRTQRKISSQLILYSDMSEAELKQRAQASGANGYFTKAAGIEALVADIKARLAKSAGAAKPTAKGRRRVLIVDDSETTVAILQAELSAKGFDVLTADSAEKAMKIILKKQTRPDLVLLDVRMPNVNGEQLCRFIKANALFSGIKVLLCSSENTEELQRICREAGADGYVSKESVLSKVLQFS